MMKVVQHNCGRGYTKIINALEYGIDMGATIVCLQEPCVNSPQLVSHPGYTMLWPSVGRARDFRVAVGVQRGSNVRVEVRTDLVCHAEVMVVDVWELDERRRDRRRTRMVNVYDQWRGEGEHRRRNIDDIRWEEVIRGRTILLGDFNAHSRVWNAHAAREDSHARRLGDIIRKFNLIIANNETATRVGARNSRSIIDLTLLAGVELVSWTVETDRQTGLDHELIAFEVAPHDGQLQETGTQSVTGWDIQGMTEEAL